MANITLRLDPMDKILLRRSLNRDGRAQKLLSDEVARVSDPYVPKLSSDLKKTRRVYTNRVEYIMPYARRQWHENAGRGLEGTASHGLRGKYWVHRAMADHGSEVVRAVAKLAGGKAK